MPGSLTELIVASDVRTGSGNQIAEAGESFRNNVTGAGDGVDMLSYRLISTSVGGTQPLPSSETTYTATSVDFPMTFTVTAYSRFNLIQLLTQSAWSLYTLGGNGTATASFQSFSWSSNVLSFTLRVRGPNPGTGPTINASAEYANGSPESYYEPVRFIVNATGSGSGTQDFTIRADYTPTGGGFESVINNAWPVRWQIRPYDNQDIEVQWFHSTTDRTNGTNIQATGSEYIPSSVPPYQFSSSGVGIGEQVTVYPRWRLVSGGGWTNVDTNGAGTGITFFDIRDPF